MDEDLRQKLDAAHEARINGEYKDAEGLYRAVLEHVADPAGEAETRHGLGCTLIFTGMFDEGLDELVLAHEKNPDDPRVFLDLAKTRLMLGMADEARPELEQIVERFPDSPEAEEAKQQLTYYQQ